MKNYLPQLRGRIMHIAAASTAITILAGPASAGIINLVGDESNATEGISSVDGSIDYTADPFGETGTLVISLTNMSDPANGGYITGFVFNIDSTDPAATATLSSASHSSFLGLTDHMAPPFGMDFSAGAALGGHWTGGGSPHGGIAVGETGTFEFFVEATDADALSAESFASGQYDHNFIIRLRGFNDGGSDKLPAMTIVPGPATLSLLILAGLAVPRRRRR